VSLSKKCRCGYRKRPVTKTRSPGCRHEQSWCTARPQTTTCFDTGRQV